MRGAGSGVDPIRANGAAPSAVVRVLDAQQRGDRLMDVGHAHRLVDRCRIGNAIDAVEGAQLDAGNDRGAAGLVEDEVRLRSRR